MSRTPNPTSYDHAPSATGAGRRILHVTTRHLRGGAERNIAHLVDWELAAGYDVDVAVGRDSDPSNLPPGAGVLRIASLVRAISPQNDLRALRELRSLIRRGSYDMVHTHLSKAGILGREAARGHTPRIVHTVHMASFGDGYGRIASMVFRGAERRAAGHSDAVLFVGDGLRDLYLTAGASAHATSAVIRSPIDIEAFAESRSWEADRRNAVRRDLGLATDDPLILAVGSLEPRKRHDLLITNLRDALHRRAFAVAIAGDGPERRNLGLLAEQIGVSDRVHFLGHVGDVVALLATADILALTSAVEGVPQVVIQALAAGRPVIATDVPGLREVPGAPITIIPSDAKGLEAAISSQLNAPPAPVEQAALSAWTHPAIDRSISAFHDRFDP